MTQIEVFLPPIYLPIIRDLMITAWNFINGECEDVYFVDMKNENGLEVLEVNVDDAVINYLQKNEVKIESIQELSNEMKGSLEIFTSGIKWFAGDLKSSRPFRNIYPLSSTHLYQYSRGFFNYSLRKFKINKEKGKEKPDSVSGRFEIKVSEKYGFLLQNLGVKKSKIKGGGSTYLVTTEPIFDKSLAKEFMRQDLEKIKKELSKTLKVLKRGKKEYPILTDFVSQKVLLEIVYTSLKSSILYSINWPTLRIYLDNQIKSHTVLEVSSSITENAKLAIISAAECVKVSPLKIISELRTLMDNGIDNKGMYVNEIYTLVNSVFQGNLDLDLFYKVKRIKMGLKP
ncbi:MAG: hypothetical protein ACPLSP_01395 [Fervidicoccus fontis]|jgi:hypothetical protein